MCRRLGWGFDCVDRDALKSVVISDSKKLIDIFNDGRERWRESHSPTRLQAKRLVQAFEAHKIEKQQILRLLPPGFDIKPTAFSRAENLEEYMTPSLLDWAAEFLVLDRRWLDGVVNNPHMVVDGYKDEAVYQEWLEERIKSEPDKRRTLFVWATSDLAASHNAKGFFSVVYAEYDVILDGQDLTRYWRFSDQWPADHRPCIDSLVKLVQICKSLEIRVVGRIVSRKALTKFEKRKSFASQAKSSAKEKWCPEDIKSRKRRI